jgi:sugar phosphate isomerase/epimerase
MGASGAAMAHLLEGLDPRYMGAYLDAGHLARTGESFPTAAGMVRPYLSIVGLKDTSVVRIERKGHGAASWNWVPAGQGVVDWTAVFTTLREAAFDGPLTVHCEFRVPEDQFMRSVRNEIAFFRKCVTG